MDEKEEKVRALAKELLTNTMAAFLATVDEKGVPWIRAVENLRNPIVFPHESKTISEFDKDEFSFYTTTNTSSDKMKHIKNNSTIALYFSMPEQYKGIMFQGKVRIITDLNFKKKMWQDNWKQFYPKGYTDPDLTILCLKPSFMKGWYKGHHILSLSDKK